MTRVRAAPAHRVLRRDAADARTRSRSSTSRAHHDCFIANSVQHRGHGPPAGLTRDATRVRELERLRRGHDRRSTGRRRRSSRALARSRRRRRATRRRRARATSSCATRSCTPRTPGATNFRVAPARCSPRARASASRRVTCWRRCCARSGFPPASATRWCAARPDASELLLYGFNGVYLASRERWILLDARGNKPGPRRALRSRRAAPRGAGRPERGEWVYPSIWTRPAPVVVDLLSRNKSLARIADHIPAELPGVARPQS